MRAARWLIDLTIAAVGVYGPSLLLAALLAVPLFTSEVIR